MGGMLYVADELRKQLLKAQKALIKITQADDLEDAKDWANGAIQAHEEWRESMTGIDEMRVAKDVEA